MSAPKGTENGKFETNDKWQCLDFSLAPLGDVQHSMTKVENSLFFRISWPIVAEQSCHIQGLCVSRFILELMFAQRTKHQIMNLP
eukprot:2756364-Amphidinium_carterae.1